MQKALSKIRLAAAIACALTAGFSTPVANAAKPNIVFFIADDLGYGDVGYHGFRDDVVTPNIDSLAEKGLHCPTYYVTSPTCGPSRAGLLTGRYQNSWSLEDHYKGSKGVPTEELGWPLEVKTLFERLKELGYATCKLGKEQMGFHPKFHPNRRGVDFFFGYRSSSAYPYISQDPRTPEEEAASLWTGHYLNDDYVVGDKYANEHLTPLQARMASEFIEKHRDEPFCVYVAFHAVHGPLKPEEKNLKAFDHLTEEGDPMPVESRRRLLAELLGVDQAVGTVVGKLRELGLEENTLVVFTSDNGGMWNSLKGGYTKVYPEASEGNCSSNGPLRGGKGTHWEGGIRVPMVMQWPAAIPGGTKADFPVISLDMMPTFLEMTGGEITPELDGINLLPWLKDPKRKAPEERALFWRKYRSWAVRDGRWKLLHTDGRKGGVTYALFDLENDPGEKTNLIDTHPEIAQRLQKAWQGWRESMPPVPRLAKTTLDKEVWEGIGYEPLEALGGPTPPPGEGVYTKRVKEKKEKKDKSKNDK